MKKLIFTFVVWNGMILLMLLFMVVYAFAHGEGRPWKGPVAVRVLPHAELLRACSGPGYDRTQRLGVIGCAYGGRLGYGGVRGKCIIYLAYPPSVRPDIYAHELAHCSDTYPQHP